MYQHHDNFLEEHIAQLIDFQMKEVKWQYDYDSKPNGTQKHWHIFCGHNIDECNLNGYDFIEPIWNNIKNVDSTLELERAYLNAHTYGIEPHIHRDDGDVTLIYYPRLDWKIDWGGGTAIYDNELNNNYKNIKKNEDEKKKIIDQLYDKKTLDHYKKSFTLKSKKISYDDFVKLATEKNK